MVLKYTYYWWLLIIAFVPINSALRADTYGNGSPLIAFAAGLAVSLPLLGITWLIRKLMGKKLKPE